MPDQPKQYITTRGVCDRYRKRDRGWPWRQQRRDPDFPKPDLYINERPHWLEAQFDEYDEKLRARPRGRSGGDA